MWFDQLFGFHEAGWSATRERFSLDDDGAILACRGNGRRFRVGRFATPSLGELRAESQRVGRPGRVRVHHEVIGDVLELHARPENRGAMFQVASQFNCLEFPGPETVPEDGVAGYAFDRTQGPACSLAAAAATVVRNYLVDVRGEGGQTRDRQLDTLAGLEEALGGQGRYFTVRNGYTSSTPGRLAALATALQDHERDDLLAAVRIGVHAGVGVTFQSRWVEPTEPTFVSQAFCSAISCGYAGLGSAPWRPLATLVLDAAYEATLRAAIVDAATGTGSSRVWLTFLGGGVFANPMEWIAAAMRRAIERVDGHELDVRIAHFRQLDGRVVELLEG